MAAPDDVRDVVGALAHGLRANVNPDGGWGYTPGTRSRIEPTSWALAALAAASAPGDGWSPIPHLQFLRRRQTPSGLLADQPGMPPNYAFSALAAVAVDGTFPNPADPWFRGLIEGIVGGRGVAFAQGDVRDNQHNDLQAWPWIDGCFSWVEPTAWCLLLLKRVRAELRDARGAARIEEAERLLVDRCCANGGWNYGNAAVLGQSLDPYVPTTAVALLALQDRREHPQVRKSLSWLEANADRERSGMALALGLICVARFGGQAGAIEAALLEQSTRSRFLDHQHVQAMALYALASGPSGREVFRV
jgi:hypothetical protein